ncbi:amidohydrolase family protein [Streptomyces sp. NPDC096311]|uniref:amidohydrolase family protein n=1 Tax=Streptomyces sp. NPDC096311 TaxID=3366083 RepID=UPI0038268082
MPLTDDIKMISIDDHLIEPAGLWTDRLPAKYHDRCPHVEEIAEERIEPFYAKTVHLKPGMQIWRYEDILEPNVGLTATAGTDVKDRNFSPIRFDQMRPGHYDPVARLADMDEDGVWAQAPFPSFPGFCGNKFVFAKDKDLALLCVRAYNDFVLDEWCAAAPDRYIPLTILPLWDQEECVAEIERCAAKGARSITFPDNPAGLGLPSYQGTAWDRVFAAAAAHEMPLSMHFGGSRIVPFVSPEAPQAAVTALFGITLFNSMAELVMSPVFVKNPKLKVAYSEGGIGWVPYALMRMDQVWESYREFPLENNVDPDRRPSDVVREHIYSCFIDDPVGIGLRHDIGVGRLLWESDYPHADSLWPNSRENAKKVFADVPTDEVRKIVETNARELFRFR